MIKTLKKTEITIILDVGKTNIKLYNFNYANGKILFEKNFNNKIIKSNNFYRVNLDKITKLLLKHISTSSRKYIIKHIIPITHGSVFISLDSKNIIVSDISDENIYSKNVNNDYKKILGKVNNTLSPILPLGYNLGKSLFFLKFFMGNDFNKMSSLLFFPQYLSWYLSNKKVSELSYLGNHSHLWDFKKNNFSKLADNLNLTNYLPKFVSAYKKIGTLKKSIAKKYNIKNKVLIYPGCHDSIACYNYHSKFNKKFTLISTGTWVLVFNWGSNFTNNMLTKDMLMNIDLKGNYIPTARFAGGIEYSLLTENLSKPQKLNYKIIQSIIDNNDFIKPSFYNGGPFMNKKGMVIVKNKNKLIKGYMWHLINLYLAQVTTYMIKTLKSDSDIIIDGIFSKNIFFKFFLTNLLTNKVKYSYTESGVAIGAYLISKPKSKIKYKVTEIKKTKLFSNALKKYHNKWEGVI